MKKSIFAYVFTAALVSLAVACASPQTGAQQQPPKPADTKPTRGGIVKDASFGDGVSLNPLLTNDSASTNYQSYLWAGLTKRDPDTYEVVGDLYETKPTLSADGKTLTWKLRKGVKWSDGKPITAGDIEFTWQKLIDPKTKFPALSFYTDSFTDVKAIDDVTVQYTLKTPGFCPALGNSGLPGPLPKSLYENGDITANPENIKPSVTSGVWKFKEWQKDDHFSVSPAYADYVDGQAFADGYTFRVVKDSTVATQLFKTQDIDFATPDPVDWDEIIKLPFVQPYTYYSPSAAWTFIGFNLRHPFLADKKVRQAITTAIDKDAMIKNIRLGHAKAQYSNITSASWAYTDDVPKFPYDPAKAKQLLKDAGWTPGSDGILQKDGKPFKIRLFYNAGNKQREQIATISQQNLKDVGIQADIVSEEFNAYLERVRAGKDVEMFILGWTGGAGEPNGTGAIWKTGGSQNFPGYANAEVDKLYDQAASVPGCSQADRKPLYVQIQKLIAEDQPYVFLYTNESLLAVNKRVKVNALKIPGVLYSPELWYIQEQK